MTLRAPQNYFGGNCFFIFRPQLSESLDRLAQNFPTWSQIRGSLNARSKNFGAFDRKCGKAKIQQFSLLRRITLRPHKITPPNLSTWCGERRRWKFAYTYFGELKLQNLQARYSSQYRTTLDFHRKYLRNFDRAESRYPRAKTTLSTYYYSHVRQKSSWSFEWLINNRV